MKIKSLAFQIFLGLVCGIVVGAIFYQKPGVVTYLKPLGDLFIRLIRMVIVPIVLASIVLGVASLGNVKKVGKLGVKTIFYFEVITTFAIVLGLLWANFFQPGAGLNLQELGKADISSYLASTQAIESGGYMKTLLNIVPLNPIDAMAKGDMLAVIFFSIMLGLGIAALGEKGEPILAFFRNLSGAMFHIVHYVLRVAPFGVFGLIGVTVSRFGLASLIPLGKLLLCVYSAMFFFAIVVFGTICKMFKIHYIELLKFIKAEILLVFSTASSETVLPQLMEKLEKYGCPKSTVSFVLPIGYSFNLDGSTLYQSIASIFVAQLYGIDMPLSAQISLVLVLMVTSKGIAGVSGMALVVLLVTFGSVGLPVEGVAFIAGIDFFLNMGRAVVNVIGNSIATILIAKWENQFDDSKRLIAIAEE